jgi:hypothetical protein
MLEDPEVKEEKRTIRNSHSNLEIIFGNVLLIVCLEKETKGGKCYSLILVDIYHIVKTLNIKCISSIDIILWMFINI